MLVPGDSAFEGRGWDGKVVKLLPQHNDGLLVEKGVLRLDGVQCQRLLLL